MNISFFITLILIVSIASSIVTTVFVGQSLDRYGATLNTELAFNRHAPGSVRTITGNTSIVERIALLREQSGAILRKKLVPSADTRKLETSNVVASGVMLTSDGWFAFPLQAGMTEATVRDMELVARDHTSVIDRVLIDKSHNILYVHVENESGVSVTFAQTQGLVPGNELYVIDMTGFVDRVRIVEEKREIDFTPTYDTDFDTEWIVSGAEGKTSILLDEELGFAGFVLHGKAIPLHTFSAFLASAIQTRGFTKATMGVSGIDMTHAQNIDTSLYTRKGFLIASDAMHLGIIPEGPAQQADLRVGDMIIAIDGIFITPTMSITKVLSSFSAGDRVTVSYVRDGAEQSTDIILANAEGLIY